MWIINNEIIRSAGSVIFWVSLADLLEDFTVKRTKNSLKNSLAINVDTVWLVNEEMVSNNPESESDLNGSNVSSGEKSFKDINEKTINEINVPISKIAKGDKIRFRTGSIIPVDGVIVSGDAMINESSMTGESLSVHKMAGKIVHAGTVIEEGSIIVKVNAIDEETRINKILEIIENSKDFKAEIQSKAENLANSIVPFSLFATLTTYLLTRNPSRALSVLMVDYSCAIKLATPISVISAMEEASNHKIMIKGRKYLENFGQAKTIVFDKTGTLTNASPKVAKIIPCGTLSREEVLRNAACLEEHFAHSVARAIVKQAELEGLKHEEYHAEVEYIVAHGISTNFKEKKL
jgi:P-type E1-E2 ATPase